MWYIRTLVIQFQGRERGTNEGEFRVDHPLCGPKNSEEENLAISGEGGERSMSECSFEQTIRHSRAGRMKYVSKFLVVNLQLISLNYLAAGRDF